MAQKKNIVSLKVAMLAKEKGFNEPTINVYIGNDLFTNKVDLSNSDFSGYDHFVEIEEFYDFWNGPKSVFTKEGNGCVGCKLDNKKYFEGFSAPTHTDLQTWLREKHNIDVNCHRNYNWWVDGYKPKYRARIHLNGDKSRRFTTNDIFEIAFDDGLEIGLNEIKL